MVRKSARGHLYLDETGGPVTFARREEAVAAIESIRLSQLNSSSSNRSVIALTKNKRSSEPMSLLPWDLRFSDCKLRSLFSGLKVRIVASAFEHALAKLTRTTASSSAQKALMPVWLMDKGTARIV